MHWNRSKAVYSIRLYLPLRSSSPIGLYKSMKVNSSYEGNSRERLSKDVVLLFSTLSSQTYSCITLTTTESEVTLVCGKRTLAYNHIRTLHLEHLILHSQEKHRETGTLRHIWLSANGRLNFKSRLLEIVERVPELIFSCNQIGYYLNCHQRDLSSN